MRSTAFTPFSLLHAVFVLLLTLICSQPLPRGPQQIEVRLCVPQSELLQCKKLQYDMKMDPSLAETRGFLQFFVPGMQQTGFIARLSCVPTHHIYECADLIKDNKADVARFAAEDLFGLQQTDYTGSLLVPIVASETSGSCSEANTDCHEFVREYAVALTKRGSRVKSWADMRDSDACFDKVGSTAGWVIPVFRLSTNYTATTTRIDPKIAGSLFRVLLDERRHNKRQTDDSPGVTYTRCPLDMSVPNAVFGKSCAPGRWAEDPNFVASYGSKLCGSCVGQNQSCFATVEQNSALNCLLSQKGDVAFIGSRSVTALFHGKEQMASDFNLLCPEGLHRARDFQGCHWGHIPEDAFLVYAANNNQRLPPAVYGEFLRQLYFASKSQYSTATELIGRSEPKRLDLSSRPVTNIETYLKRYGGHQFYEAMEKSFPACKTTISMRLCVISSEEQEKCNHIRVAFRAAALPIPLECVVGVSDNDCVDKLNRKEADLAVMNSYRADEYMHAGKIRPILAEINDHSDFAVAVALAVGRVRNLHDLGNADSQLNVCSSGTDSFAGWDAPNRIFKDIGIIDAGECDKLTERWATMFRTSCVPGAKNATVTQGRKSPIDEHQVNGLCAGCGGGAGSCLTPQEVAADHPFEMYYGDIGALRCLLGRKGDVAFLRSSALQTMQLLRQYNNDRDFRQIGDNQLTLLCGDGIGPMPYSEANVLKCNLGKTPRRWMVSKPDATDLEVLYWQDYWELGVDRARSQYDWLKTFVHVTPGKTEHLLDVIFSNSTIGFERFPLGKLTEEYIHDFAYGEWKSPFECGSHGVTIQPTLAILAFLIVLLFKLDLCW